MGSRLLHVDGERPNVPASATMNISPPDVDCCVTSRGSFHAGETV